MSRLGAAFLSLLCLGGAPVTAQSRAPLAAEVARLERRVDSLRTGRQHAALLAAAAATGAPPAADGAFAELVEAGRLRIRVNRSPLPVGAGAEEAWARFEDYFGTAAAELPFRAIRLEAIDPDSAHGAAVGADLTLPWDRSAREVMVALLQATAPTAHDSALTAWSAGPPAPIVALPEALAQARSQMILAPISTGRDCLSGLNAACRAAFALLPDGAPLEAAFPRAEDRLEGVALMFRGAGRPDLRELIDRCLGSRDDEACAEALRSADPATRPAVASSATRRTLLAVALRRGGREAFGRLRRAAGRPMAERLALAAGVPIDSVLAEWRLEAGRAARITTPWSARVGVEGIVWCGLLLLCSLRSSRWRAD